MLARLAPRTWAEVDSPGRSGSFSFVVFLLLRAELRAVSGIRRQRRCRCPGLRRSDPLRPNLRSETRTFVSGVFVRSEATHSWNKTMPRWTTGKRMYILFPQPKSVNKEDDTTSGAVDAHPRFVFIDSYSHHSDFIVHRSLSCSQFYRHKSDLWRFFAEHFFHIKRFIAMFLFLIEGEKTSPTLSNWLLINQLTN